MLLRQKKKKKDLRADGPPSIGWDFYKKTFWWQKLHRAQLVLLQIGIFLKVLDRQLLYVSKLLSKQLQNTFKVHAKILLVLVCSGHSGTV